jgi:hypothetical protein
VFHEYRVSIIYLDGRTVDGYAPVSDAAKRMVRFAATENDMPLSANASLVGVKMLVLSRVGAGVLPKIGEGRPVRIRVEGGEVMTGTSRPVPVPGGTWLRPDRSPDDRLLVFVPEAAVAELEVTPALMYGPPVATPMDGYFDTVAPPPETKPSAASRSARPAKPPMPGRTPVPRPATSTPTEPVPIPAVARPRGLGPAGLPVRGLGETTTTEENDPFGEATEHGTTVPAPPPRASQAPTLAPPPSSGPARRADTIDPEASDLQIDIAVDFGDGDVSETQAMPILPRPKR